MGVTTGGLPWPDGTAKVADGDDAIRALAEALDTPWEDMTLISAFAPIANVKPPAFRRVGGVVQIRGSWLARTAGGVTTLGAAVTVEGLPEGMRPTLVQYGPAGTIGVAGVTGASGWRVMPTGELQFISLVATGTMATGGAFGNHLGMPSWEVFL